MLGHGTALFEHQLSLSKRSSRFLIDHKSAIILQFQDSWALFQRTSVDEYELPCTDELVTFIVLIYYRLNCCNNPGNHSCLNVCIYVRASPSVVLPEKKIGNIECQFHKSKTDIEASTFCSIDILEHGVPRIGPSQGHHGHVIFYGMHFSWHDIFIIPRNETFGQNEKKHQTEMKSLDVLLVLARH